MVENLPTEFEKFCKSEGKPTYCRMRKTKLEFVERTMQFFENIHVRSMEDYKNKYINKLSRFVATLIAGKISIDLILKNVEKYEFFQPLRQATTIL